MATDLTTQREVWFQTGPLAKAIRASIAIPSVITPVNYEGRILADGGITNPVPLEPLASVVADATIAVTLSGKLAKVGASALAEEKTEEDRSPGWIKKLWALGWERGEKDRPSPEDSEAQVEDFHNSPSFSPLPGALTVMDVITMSLETMEGAIERYRMAANSPDLLVSIPRDSAGTYDFHRAHQIADIGRDAARAAFDRLGLWDQ